MARACFSGGLFQVDEDGRLSSGGEAAEEIQVGRFLERTFEPFGDLLKGILDGRAGPGRRDHHRLDGERCVLVAAEKVVAHQTPNYCPNREMDDEPAMPKLSAHSESSFSHFAKGLSLLTLDVGIVSRAWCIRANAPFPSY